MSSLGTSATNWPIVLASDDRRWWRWSSRGNENWYGKPKYSEKTCPCATLSITNPTCCPDANPGCRVGKPATNRLSYGTAFSLINIIFTSGCVSSIYAWTPKISPNWIGQCLLFSRLWYSGMLQVKFVGRYSPYICFPCGLFLNGRRNYISLSFVFYLFSVSTSFYSYSLQVFLSHFLDV
jgi:hypothetical protein